MTLTSMSTVQDRDESFTGVQNSRYWRSRLQSAVETDSEVAGEVDANSATLGQVVTSLDSGMRRAAVERERVLAIGQIIAKERPVLPVAIRVSGMQKWEGRVLEGDGEFFTAELKPSDPSQTTVVGDFEQSQLGIDSPAVPGDVVYVTVRTVEGPNGYPYRTSAVRLRRLGRWTAEEIRLQHERAEVMREEIKGLVF